LKIAPVRAERIYSDARCDRVYDLWDAMTPFSTGGVYANNLGEEESIGFARLTARTIRGWLP
jgi:hypothetical protein